MIFFINLAIQMTSSQVFERARRHVLKQHFWESSRMSKPSHLEPRLQNQYQSWVRSYRSGWKDCSGWKTIIITKEMVPWGLAFNRF